MGSKEAICIGYLSNHVYEAYASQGGQPFMVDWTAALWIGPLLCRPEGDEEKEGPVLQSQVTNAGELARKECVSGVTRSWVSHIRVGEHAPHRGRAGELEHSSAAG